MAEPILRTESLTRELAGRRIVDGVTVAVARGEILAVMGPSGSGKTSFLRMLNRLDEATSGSAFLGGAEIRSLQPCELRRRVGMVLQTPWLFAGTVNDNLAFGPRQRGAELTAGQAEDLLAQVRLGGYGGRDAGRLSGGEAQRVSVARTLANEPEVLLLDEPTSALDAESKGDVEQLLSRIVRERQLGCVLVTHDPGQARRLADRVLVLIAGKADRVGPAAEILDQTAAAVLGAGASGSGAGGTVQRVERSS